MCTICKESGELLLCDTCNLVYHMSCLDPPLTAVPPGMWLCPKCKVRYVCYNKALVIFGFQGCRQGGVMGVSAPPHVPQRST